MVARRTVLSALQALPGVESAWVHAPTNQVSAEFDNTQVCADELVDAIIEAGFSANVVTQAEEAPSPAVKPEPTTETQPCCGDAADEPMETVAEGEP